MPWQILPVPSRGYLLVARVQGIPLRIHWSTPLGMLFFGRFAFVPGFWLGYLLLVGVHEAGHAWLARRMGLRPLGIEIHALGGQCRYAGDVVSAWQRAVIAWGGVLAQAALLALALVARLAPWPPGAVLDQLFDALTWTNVWLMGLNLLPLPPLDGAEAWPLFGLLRGKLARRREKAARSRLVRSARDVPGPLDVGAVDDAAVRETVRRALADAAKGARRGPRSGA
jgi:Zn-dependent protease